MRHRVNLRLFSGLWVTVLAGLLLAVDSIAAPGGGSSGFGGGGGGGGGGGFSGGGSGSGSGEGSPWVFVFALAVGLLLFGFGLFKAARLRKRRRERAARVTLASAEAAADDAHFAADAVSAEAAALHRDIVAAWTARDREALGRYLGPDLLAEWVRRLDDFDRQGWHNVCEIIKPTEVEYLGLTNREDDAEDRVVVRLTAHLRDVVIDRNGNVIKRNEEDDEQTTLAEYWTLGRAGDRWILHSIEQDAEGAHHLDAPIVASPWSDDARLHDEAVTELAVADAVPDVAGPRRRRLRRRRAHPGARPLGGRRALRPGRARGGRAARRRGVGGGGRRRRRRARARGHAGGGARAALPARGEHPARGPRPEAHALRIAALDAEAKPPTFTVEAELSGRRYLEDRDTVAVIEGSKDRATTFTERWTLALGDDPATPWRIVDDRRRGLSPAARGPQRLRGPRRGRARRDRRRVRHRRRAAARRPHRPRPPPLACSRSRASRARCTRRCWTARARRSSGST